MAEWYTDKYGNMKRTRRVLQKDCELFGNGIDQPHHPSHIVASERAMRQEDSKHAANRVVCPLTGRIFRHARFMHKYHASLQTKDPNTGLFVITHATLMEATRGRPEVDVTKLDRDGDGNIDVQELLVAGLGKASH